MTLHFENSLSELISEGNDAFSNIYDVEFSFNIPVDVSVYKGIKYRIDAFNPPERVSETEDIPFQGTTVKKIVPGSSTQKESTFSIRLDRGMKYYELIHSLIPMNSKGFNDNFNDTTFTLTVRAYESEGGTPIYAWVFYNCKFTKTEAITLSYSNSDKLTVPVNFIYEYHNSFRIEEMQD